MTQQGSDLSIKFKETRGNPSDSSYIINRYEQRSIIKSLVEQYGEVLNKNGT